MLVFDQVSDESFACLGVELIGGIADTGTIRNELLGIADALVGKFSSGLTVAE